MRAQSRSMNEELEAMRRKSRTFGAVNVSQPDSQPDKPKSDEDAARALKRDSSAKILQKSARGFAGRRKSLAVAADRVMKKQASDGFVRVFVRVRPLGEGRGERGDRVCVDASINRITITTARTHAGASRSNLAAPEVHPFDFERVCDHEENNAALLQTVGKPLVDAVTEGYNGTLFAYGQTGSGKTYTMGEMTKLGTEHEGVAHRMVRALYASLVRMGCRSFTVRVQFVQIYVENVHDLLSEPGRDGLTSYAPHAERRARVGVARVRTRRARASSPGMWHLLTRGIS
jgi:hypothetical protein